jgi:AlwI restriction endonuclease
MQKPWSITTTVRNPERMRNFLKVLQAFEGQEWTLENQEKYQIALIQNRFYGYGSQQFYNDLPLDKINLLEDLKHEISFDEAKTIFELKGYEDPAMRGRQSLNPLKKFGFVVFKEKVLFISQLGKYFLTENYDFGEVVFRMFLKWQLPNPASKDYKRENGVDIKPFIGTLHLINKVNQLEEIRGNKTKGLSKEEFSLFVPTLINFQEIEKQAQRVIDFRSKTDDKPKAKQKEIKEKLKFEFVKDFLGIDDTKQITTGLNNIKDYGDNTLRYFRLTRFLYIRGGGFFVDLEPRRQVEIQNLLNFDNGQSLEFASSEAYFEYLADLEKPELPWETNEELLKIVESINIDIFEEKKKLTLELINQISFVEKSEQDLNKEELKIYIEELRNYRRKLQELQNKQQSQEIENIKTYIFELENIYNSKKDKPVELEKYTTLGLNALNDALNIHPNYPVGDDNEPTFTAPAGKPDIECYYAKYNAICEVTMLNGRDQWFNEGQPVMRHLRNFEDKYTTKTSYCLFIAPKIHQDTVNTFWFSVKYEYQGKKQNIVPLTINQFVSLLETLVEIKQADKRLNHQELFSLYDDILYLTNKVDNSLSWLERIPDTITNWKVKLAI